VTSAAPHPPHETRPGTVATGKALVHTAAEAAAIIGGNCKASWLKARARAREFPCEMIGGAYGFTDAHIAEIIAICEVPARRAAQPAPAPAPAKKTPAKRATVPVSRALPAGVTLLEVREPRKRNVA
jgi:hypothetical protein